MKKVVFPDKKQFILTNREFAEAYVGWHNDGEYLCGRLDSIITKYYSYTAPLYDNTDWAHLVLPEDTSLTLAYNKEKNEIQYVVGWPFEKLLNSITGGETYAGCIPKKMEIEDPIEDKIKLILAKTMSIDDYIDMKYKK